ncbi:hypothetical protein ACKA04_04570 [Helcococcus kunzii]|uniref:hypothetical protein n=1 Tax=Helcococcus kunzii TaxID=40091 RepID=UPI0038B1A454
MNKRQEEILKRIKEREQERKKLLEYLEYLENNPDIKYKIENALITINEVVSDALMAVKTVLEDFFESLNSVAEKIAKKKEKTYRFEIEGFCEIDIDATSMEEAEQKCEEAMREIFDKDLFTDYRFVEEVEND